LQFDPRDGELPVPFEAFRGCRLDGLVQGTVPFEIAFVDIFGSQSPHLARELRGRPVLFVDSVDLYHNVVVVVERP